MRPVSVSRHVAEAVCCPIPSAGGRARPGVLLRTVSFGGADNRSFYSNAEMDALVKEQSQATDVNKRIATGKEIERRILIDAVVVPDLSLTPVKAKP